MRVADQVSSRERRGERGMLEVEAHEGSVRGLCSLVDGNDGRPEQGRRPRHLAPVGANGAQY
jgi:hypothetical protein